MNGTGPTQVVLRPLGTPLPLGFLGLFVATTSFSGLQLQWVGRSQTHHVALAVLVLTVPAQLVASVFGFLSRDPVAGTGLGVQAGTWAATALVSLSLPAGATSPGLGLVLLAGGAAMLVPAAAGRMKVLAAAVMVLSALRFMLTGVAEMAGTPTWSTVAGCAGLVLAVASLYAALAFEVEDTDHRTVLPTLRRGAAAAALHDDAAGQVADVAHEPGVRKQL